MRIRCLKLKQPHCSRSSFQVNLKHTFLFPEFSFKRMNLATKSTVELQLPKPTFDGILAALGSEKHRHMLSTAYLQIKSFKRSCNWAWHLNKQRFDRNLSTQSRIFRLPNASECPRVKQFAELNRISLLQGKFENVTMLQKSCCSHATCREQAVLSRLKDTESLFHKDSIQDNARSLHLPEWRSSLLKLDEARFCKISKLQFLLSWSRGISLQRGRFLLHDSRAQYRLTRGIWWLVKV